MHNNMSHVDAQRIWFPELIDQLRSEWRADLSFDALVTLRENLDAALQQIRRDRQIHSANVRCPQCRRMAESPAPQVSVRAMILSLLRFEIAPAEQVHALEKSWAAHRKQNTLDILGKPAQPTPATLCRH
jgi:hypothetical protein